MAARTTTDHDEIRTWVEDNNGRPAKVKGTGGKNDAGLLRIDFDEPEEGLEAVEWDDWFETFDREKLALLHEEDGRFNKLVAR